MQSGYLAAISFLVLTGGGFLAQVLKLHNRSRARSSSGEQIPVTSGLKPFRELWSYVALFLFALSALTRSYIDYYILLSRLPVVLLETVILWYLLKDRIRGSASAFVVACTGNAAVVIVMLLTGAGYRFDGTLLTHVVNGSLGAVSVLLFLSKQAQAFAIFRDKRAEAVSWLRELGVATKDAAGLFYSLSVGTELRWISLTHFLSGTASLTIVAAKYFVERNRTKS